MSYGPYQLRAYVEEACLDKTGFKKIHIDRMVDFEQLIELHQNMANHLTKHGYQNLAQTLPLLEKPVIYYEKLMNEKRVMELRPIVCFTPKAVQQAQINDLITKRLLVLPADAFTYKLKILLESSQDSAENLALTEGSPLIKALTSLQDTSPGGGVTFYCNVAAEQALVLAKGPINIYGRWEVRDMYVQSLLDDIHIETLKNNAEKDRKATLIATGILTLIAGNNLGFIGAETSSGLKTLFKAMNNIFDVPVVDIAERTASFAAKRVWHAEDTTTVTHTPSIHMTAGEMELEAAFDMHLMMSKYYGPTKKLKARNIKAGEVHDIIAKEIQHKLKKKKGVKKDIHEQTIQKLSRGVEFYGGLTEFEATDVIDMTNPKFADLETRLKAPKVHLRSGQNLTQGQRRTLYQGLIWDKDRKEDWETPEMLPLQIQGTVIIDADTAVVENAPNPNLVQGDNVEHKQVHQDGHHNEKTKKKLSQKAKMAIHGIVTAAMIAINPGQIIAEGAKLAGAAGAAATAAGTTAATCLTSSMVVNTIDDGMKGLRRTFHAKELKKLGKTTLISGLTAGLAHEFSAVAGLTSEQVTFYEKAQKALIKSTVAAAVQTALEGGKLGQNVLDCLKQGAVDFAAAEAAGGIGDLKTDAEINYTTHKILHGILGGVMAELSGYDFASGALGAVVAETIGELVADMTRPRVDDNDKTFAETQFDVLAEGTDKGLTKAELYELNHKFVQAESLGKRAAFVGKLAAIGSALALDLDVGGANLAACNAVENNLTKHLVAAVFVGGAMSLTALDVRKAYIQAGGGDAGLIAAAQVLGEDVVIAMVGGAAIKVIARTGKPLAQFIKETGDTIPIIGYALKSAEKAVLSGVGKVKAGAAHVADKVGGAVSNSAVGKAGKVVAQKAEDVVAKTGQKLGKKPASCDLKAGTQNGANAARHRTELLFKEQGLLDANGKLTQKAIDESIVLRLSDGAINNPSVVAELTKDGSKIVDWAKCTTKHVTNSGKQKLQIHYYKNVKTGKIDYSTNDFKVKQVVDVLR